MLRPKHQEGVPENKVYQGTPWRLGGVILLFSTFSLCELFVGWHFNSVALVSDAAAMIIDSLSFILNYFAVSYVHEYSVWAKIVAPLLSLSILYILVFFFFLPDAMDQIWGKVPVEDQFQLPILDILFPIIIKAIMH